MTNVEIINAIEHARLNLDASRDLQRQLRHEGRASDLRDAYEVRALATLAKVVGVLRAIEGQEQVIARPHVLGAEAAIAKARML